MKPLRIVFLLFLFITTSVLGQEGPTVDFTGFSDIYYFYDFNSPQDGQRQPFVFNHNRHNEFNVNLALLSLKVFDTKYRSNLAFQAGTYANDNYAAEPGVLKNLFEANIGVSLNKKNSLWLDAGIFPSHMGFESAISTDNPTLTRSLCAESSPYFLSGAKITLTASDQWEFSTVVSNGWQRIHRVPGNSMPSFGTQVIFQPNKNTTLNWSTFITTEDPDSTRRMRYFSNLYGLFEISNKINLTAGFDFGIQQTTMNSSDYDLWFTPILIAQYLHSEKWHMAFRVEYFQDENNVIIATVPNSSFDALGISYNLDYRANDAVTCRWESRIFNSSEKNFIVEDELSRTNFFTGFSIAIKLDQQL